MTTIATSLLRRSVGVAAISLLAVGVSACGDDDKDDAAADEPTATTEAETASGIEDYCAASLKVEDTARELGGPESDPVDTATQLLEVVKEAKAVAPDEIAPEVDAGIEVLTSVIDTGDGSLLETFDGASIHAFDLQNCGWSTTDVTAADYSFSGVPETLDAGVHSFEMHNEGTEPHVMLVVGKAEGVTESFEELMAGDFLSDGKTFAAAAAFVAPGEDGYGVGTLEPGDYLVMCPIPTGTTFEAEGTGPPHFMNGMQQELTVE